MFIAARSVSYGGPNNFSVYPSPSLELGLGLGLKLGLDNKPGFCNRGFIQNHEKNNFSLFPAPSDDAINPNHVVNCESTSLPSGVRCVPPNSHTATTYTGWAEVLTLNQYYKISS